MVTVDKKKLYPGTHSLRPDSTSNLRPNSGIDYCILALSHMIAPTLSKAGNIPDTLLTKYPFKLIPDTFLTKCPLEILPDTLLTTYPLEVVPDTPPPCQRYPCPSLSHSNPCSAQSSPDDHCNVKMAR